MYNVIRLIISFVIALIVTVILWKTKQNKKQALVLFIVILVLSSFVLDFFPFENYFYTFKSPNSVTEYVSFRSPNFVIEGKDSTLTIIKESPSKDNVSIIPKNNEGWKIPAGNKNSSFAISSCNDCGVNILIDKYSGDTYLFASSLGEYTLNLNDSNNSKFVLIDENVFYEYVAYIGNFDSNYKLKVNNHTYKFILSDVDSKNYEMQQVE